MIQNEEDYKKLREKWDKVIEDYDKKYPKFILHRKKEKKKINLVSRTVDNTVEGNIVILAGFENSNIEFILVKKETSTYDASYKYHIYETSSRQELTHGKNYYELKDKFLISLFNCYPPEDCDIVNFIKRLIEDSIERHQKK